MVMSLVNGWVPSQWSPLRFRLLSLSSDLLSLTRTSSQHKTLRCQLAASTSINNISITALNGPVKNWWLTLLFNEVLQHSSYKITRKNHLNYTALHVHHATPVLRSFQKPSLYCFLLPHYSDTSVDCLPPRWLASPRSCLSVKRYQVVAISKGPLTVCWEER